VAITIRRWIAYLESAAGQRWSPALVGAGLVLWVCVLLPFWSIFELNPDEGGNLAKSVLMTRGYRLYHDIWSDQPPLVTWLGAALAELSGPSIVAARLMVLGFSVLMVALLFAALRRRYGALPALIGAGLLMLAPSIALLSVSFMIGMVSVSLFVAALVSLLRAEEVPARASAWLALSGVLAALGVAAKLFVLPLAALLGLYALVHHGRRALAYAGTLLATVAVIAWLCGSEALIQLSQPHVVAFADAQYREHGRLISAQKHLGLFVVAGFGVVLALARREWLPVACLLYGVAVMLLHRPFHAHHMVLIAVPAAWLAAIAVAAWLGAYDRAVRERRPRTALAGGFALGLLAVIGFLQLRATWRSGVAAVVDDQRDSVERRVLLSSVRAYAGDNPWVLTDRPMYALQAGLQVLPELAIISDKRMTMLEGGPPEFFNALVDKYRHPQVLLLRHDNYPAMFTAQLQREYRPLPHASPRTRHFVQATALAAERRPRLDDFRDGIEHFERRTPEAPVRYADDDFIRIADTVVLQQERDGGWAANLDPRLRLDDGARAALRRRQLELAQQTDKARRTGRLYHRLKGASLDNGATVAEIRYLMQVYELTRDPRYRHAAARGLDYLFATQTACGGWPHSSPPTEPYHARLTILDGVTINPLRLLRDVALGRVPFQSFDQALRRRAAAAHEHGLACLLTLQVRIAGAPTGWAGQYDATTLAPANGRSFELVGLTSRETVEVVEYLLTLDDPSPPVVAAIDGAVRWLRGVELDGVALHHIAVRSQSGVALEDDLRLDDEPGASLLWARYYEIPNNRPFVADRSGRKYYDWNELPRERRVNYEWYGPFASTLLLVDYPSWRARRARAASRARSSTVR
jgi:PelA/Pel-15E family pectate lyase